MKIFNHELHQSLLVKLAGTLIIALFAIAVFVAVLDARGSTANTYSFVSPSGKTTLHIDENCGNRCAYGATLKTQHTASGSRTMRCEFDPIVSAMTSDLFHQIDLTWNDDETQITWRSTQPPIGGEIDIHKDCVTISETYTIKR